MSNSDYIGINELCESIRLSEDVIIQIVEHGIIEPAGNIPENWQFSLHMVTTTRKAMRLHHDLDIDWPGIALALSLIDELEQLRLEKKTLQQRLSRFEEV